MLIQHSEAISVPEILSFWKARSVLESKEIFSLTADRDGP